MLPVIPDLTALLLIALATGAIIDYWLNAVVWIIRIPREWFERRGAYLPSCAYCLTVWVAIAVTGLYFCGGQIPVLILAAMRLSWLLNKMLAPPDQYEGDEEDYRFEEPHERSSLSVYNGEENDAS